MKLQSMGERGVPNADYKSVADHFFFHIAIVAGLSL